MHRVRQAVVENRLFGAGGINERSYAPYVLAADAWVGEIDGEVAGFAALNAADRSVWALFVHPAAEAAGLGKALHDRLLERARESEDSSSSRYRRAPGPAPNASTSRRGGSRRGARRPGRCGSSGPWTRPRAGRGVSRETAATHFPIQKLAKISPRTDSLSTAPVTRPSARAARRTSSAASSAPWSSAARARRR